MEITLEKIELVKDRTGATYKEAKDALEAANGSVVDAIIAIEESINKDFDEATENTTGSKIIDKAKEIVAKGNMSRIIVRKGEETIVNFPLTAGVVGAVLVPWGVIFGAIAAVGFNCAIEFVNDKGEIVDINGAVVGMYDKGVEFTGAAKEKFDSFNLKEKIDDLNIKEKIDDLNIKDKIDELNLKESFDELKEQAGNFIKKTASDEEIQFGDDTTVDVDDVINETFDEEEI